MSRKLIMALSLVLVVAAIPAAVEGAATPNPGYIHVLNDQVLLPDGTCEGNIEITYGLRPIESDFALQIVELAECAIDVRRVGPMAATSYHPSTVVVAVQMTYDPFYDCNCIGQIVGYANTTVGIPALSCPEQSTHEAGYGAFPVRAYVDERPLNWDCSQLYETKWSTDDKNLQRKTIGTAVTGANYNSPVCNTDGRAYCTFAQRVPGYNIFELPDAGSVLDEVLARGQWAHEPVHLE